MSTFAENLELLDKTLDAVNTHLDEVENKDLEKQVAMEGVMAKVAEVADKMKALGIIEEPEEPEEVEEVSSDLPNGQM